MTGRLLYDLIGNDAEGIVFGQDGHNHLRRGGFELVVIVHADAAVVLPVSAGDLRQQRVCSGGREIIAIGLFPIDELVKPDALQLRKRQLQIIARDLVHLGDGQTENDKGFAVIRDGNVICALVCIGLLRRAERNSALEKQV